MLTIQLFQTGTVQGGTPMAAQGESATLLRTLPPDATRPRADFILVLNIPTGGPRTISNINRGILR